MTRKRRWTAVPQMIWPRLGRFGADFALRHDHLVVDRRQRAFGDLRLGDLPVPLRVTATDAATGEGVVLRQGRLVDVLRASASARLATASGAEGSCWRNCRAVPIKTGTSTFGSGVMTSLGASFTMGISASTHGKG